MELTPTVEAYFDYSQSSAVTELVSLTGDTIRNGMRLLSYVHIRTCTTALISAFSPSPLHRCPLGCTKFFTFSLGSHQAWTALLSFSLSFSMSCIYLKHHLLLCQHSVRTKKRKRKKWCFPQAKTPSNQNLVSHPAFLTTKCGFLENTTSDTARRNALLVSKCLCWDAAPPLFSADKMGALWKLTRRFSPQRTASVLALRCWRKEF